MRQESTEMPLATLSSQAQQLHWLLGPFLEYPHYWKQGLRKVPRQNSIVGYICQEPVSSSTGRFLRYWKGTLSVLFLTRKARCIYGSGTLALGYLLNEQVLELTSSWRLINHHIPKGMGRGVCMCHPTFFLHLSSSRYPGP